MAKANSSDGSAANGGDLGWFGAGQMVPEFETAVQGDGGRRRSPSRCRAQFGWHLIKLNEKRETTPPALEPVRAARSRTSCARQALEAKLDELRAAADDRAAGDRHCRPRRSARATC